MLICQVSLQSPIHYSNVALIDPVTKGAVRVSRQYLEDGSKVRDPIEPDACNPKQQF